MSISIQDSLHRNTFTTGQFPSSEIKSTSARPSECPKKGQLGLPLPDPVKVSCNLFTTDRPEIVARDFYCGHKTVVYVLFYFVKEIRPQRIIADNLSYYVLGTRVIIIIRGHSFLLRSLLRSRWLCEFVNNFVDLFSPNRKSIKGQWGRGVP